MTKIDIEPWEPEETVGKLWHAFASRLDAPVSHQDGEVGLDEVGGRLAVFFRALGGGHAVEIRPAAPERIASQSGRGSSPALTPRLSVSAITALIAVLAMLCTSLAMVPAPISPMRRGWSDMEAMSGRNSS